MKGKGIFTWALKDIEAGNPARIADMAVAAGLKWVAVKIANGIGDYNISVDLPAIVAALRSKGIDVWGWHYIYGLQPTVEAAKAIEKIRWLGVDGYIIDAESEWKTSGMSARATLFCQHLRAGIGDLPVALSSYRFPELHPQFPYQEFLAYTDVAMPMVYWEKAHNPSEQLDETIQQYRALGFKGPIIPAGSAYSHNDWVATPGDITEFLDRAVSLELMGALFWEWSKARAIPGLWEAIAAFKWPSSEPVDPVMARIEAIERELAEQRGLYEALLERLQGDEQRTAQSIDQLSNEVNKFNVTVANIRTTLTRAGAVMAGGQ